MSLIDGDNSRYEEKHKPHLSWDWYDHGLEDGDLIQGPYFPQVYPQLLEKETELRENKEIGYFSASWSNMIPFIKNALKGLSRTRKKNCDFSVDPASASKQ